MTSTRTTTTRRARGRTLVVAALVATTLAGCWPRIEGSTLLTVGDDRTVPIQIRCDHQTSDCVGTVLVRIGVHDSEPAAYAVPSQTEDTVIVTLTEDQYALVPSDGYVPGEIVLDASLPADDEPTDKEVGLHRVGAFTSTISVAADGTPGNGSSSFGSLNADGRYAAFVSNSTNLVPGDENGFGGAYVRDRRDGTTERVSRTPDGGPPDGGAGSAAISASGQVVAYSSNASNLVDDDTNGEWDVFVYDRETGETTRVSVATDGTQGNGESSGEVAISGNGRVVAFWSFATNLVDGDTNGIRDVFVHDRLLGTTVRASVSSSGAQANFAGSSSPPALSSEGHQVVFQSAATNLVPNDTNAREDIFVHDLLTSTTTRVSVPTGGGQANSDSHMPAISGDGTNVAFLSNATNLVSFDSNLMGDIFVHDRVGGTTVRVSVSSSGAQANGSSYYPTISYDGRYVAYYTSATNIPFNNAGRGIIHFDRLESTIVKLGGGNPTAPVISADGRHVTWPTGGQVVVRDTTG